MDEKNISANTPAFPQINNEKNTQTEIKAREAVENVFADGLPEWSLEPPQVVVRRRRK